MSEMNSKAMNKGAVTPLWCAVNDELNGIGGVYCEDCNIAIAVSESTSPYGVLPWAIDEEKASQLWKLSEELTGITFPIKWVIRLNIAMTTIQHRKSTV